MGQVNAAIGPPGIAERARAAVADYYAFLGRSGFGNPVTDRGRLRETVAAYAALGTDEVILYCYAEQPEQVDAPASAIAPTT